MNIDQKKYTAGIFFALGIGHTVYPVEPAGSGSKTLGPDGLYFPDKNHVTTYLLKFYKKLYTETEIQLGLCVKIEIYVVQTSPISHLVK
jgi:hypothetical protein